MDTMAQHALKRIRALSLNDPLYKNSIFNLLSSLFNSASGLIFWILAARLYSIDDIGIATGLISSLGIVMLFSRLGFDVAIIRFFPIFNKSKVLMSCLIITTLATFLITAIYLILVHLFSPQLSFIQIPQFAFIFLLIAVSNSLALITGAALVADRSADRYLFQIIILGLRIPLLLPFAFLGSIGILASIGMAQLIAFAFSFIFLRGSILSVCIRIDKIFLKDAFKFSFWSYLSNILVALPTLILPLIFLNLANESETAKYYITYSLSSLLLVMPTAMGTSLFVEGSHGESLKRGIIRASIVITAFIIPAMTLFFISGRELLGLINNEYADAFDLLRIFTISCPLVAAVSLFCTINNIKMNVGIITKLNLVRFFLLLGLSYLLIPKYGIEGAGYAWLITYIVISLLVLNEIRYNGLSMIS